MQFCESWLRSYINPNMNINDICQLLTQAGLELESIQPTLENSSNLIIAKIIKVNKISGTKLNLCEVDIKTKKLTVVCGANNIKPDMLVVLATSNSILKGKKITSKQFNNITSNGFICAANEINLNDEPGMLELDKDAKIGECAINHLKLNDNIIDLAITPNRGDCLSMIGIAREIHALTDAPLTLPEIQVITPTTDKKINVTVSNTKACPKYFGRIISNINTKAKTPFWIKNRLSKSGIRSISPVVDITNYVMLELGQPMHAFDTQKIKGNINVRNAKHETLNLLDDTTIQLTSNNLVIADDNEALALAGIMGGLNSSINDDTTEIFLESAFFDPISTALSAREHKLNTDSSFRFEREIDHNLAHYAIEYATKLLLDIVSGNPGPITKQTTEISQPNITLRLNRIKKIIGIEIKKEKILNILTKLGMTILLISGACFDISVKNGGNFT